MLRRLLCSKLAAALPAPFTDCRLGVAAGQCATVGTASSFQGLHSKAVQPCVSLLDLVGAQPRDLRAPAPTHAQQAAAALRSPFQHGSPATCEAERHGIQQPLSSAVTFQQAFIRQPVAHATEAAAPGPRRRASWPCQVAALRAQRQVLQLLARKLILQQEQALAARMERWAQRSGAEDMLMDSVRRKRKHKMNKHKHRKRRKAQRHKT